MSAAKKQKTGATTMESPEGRGLLCISLDSQSVEAALESMAGASDLRRRPLRRLHPPSAGCCLRQRGARVPQGKRWRRYGWT
jgi:hypothetical protein